MTETFPLTCESLIPEYVITPVELLYDNEPSPALSVTEIAPLASESVYVVTENAPVELLYDKSPPAENKPLIAESDKPASVSVPAASSYVDVIFVPPITKPFTISSISSSVLPEELIVSVPFASSYDVVIFVPAVINAFTLSSTLSL